MAAEPGGGAVSAVADEVSAWSEACDRFAASRPAGEPALLRSLRQQGQARFQALGFPTTRLEDWRHTSVASLVRATFRPAEEGDGRRVAEEGVSALTFGRPSPGTWLVFVNGRFAPALSSRPEDGIEAGSLQGVLARDAPVLAPWLGSQPGGEGNAFAALNTAFLQDGAWVRVPANTVVSRPIHVVFIASSPREATVSHPRLLLVLGPNAQATVVESYGGRDGQVYLTNAVTEAFVGDNAHLDHYKVQWESDQAFHTATFGVRQARDSRFSSHAISLGGALVRNDVRHVFAGEGAECVLNGLFLAGGRQHTDTHTWVDHARPHCTSRQTYKGVLDDEAHGVFVGKVTVRAGAQKTDAIQTNKNLLLSRQALVDSLPQLEILANDVKCKHGSTTGQLDPTALFYLRSRGLGEETARALLVYAFASDLVGRIQVPALRTGLTEYLQQHLPGALADIAESVA